MNGVLLGVILIAIFLTGIFTGTSVDTTPSNTQPKEQSETIDSAQASMTANTQLELYRVVGKTFDPYLLSVENCGARSLAVSQMFPKEKSIMPEMLRTRTLSLRSESPVPIYHADGESELNIEDIQIGDMLLVIRNEDTNEILRITVGQNTSESSELI